MQPTKDILEFAIGNTNKAAPLFERGLIRAIVLKLPKFTVNSGVAGLTFAAATKTITRAVGSFLTDGFIVGQTITTDAALNPGPFTITNVEALVITVSEAVVDEGPVNKTVTATTATQASRIDILDDDGDSIYANTTGWAENAIHLIGNLFIPVSQNYQAKVTLDAAAGNAKSVTVKTYIETVK